MDSNGNSAIKSFSIVDYRSLLLLVSVIAASAQHAENSCGNRSLDPLPCMNYHTFTVVNETVQCRAPGIYYLAYTPEDRPGRIRFNTLTNNPNTLCFISIVERTRQNTVEALIITTNPEATIQCRNGRNNISTNTISTATMLVSSSTRNTSLYTVIPVNETSASLHRRMYICNTTESSIRWRLTGMNFEIFNATNRVGTNRRQSRPEFNGTALLLNTHPGTLTLVLVITAHAPFSTPSVACLSGDDVVLSEPENSTSDPTSHAEEVEKSSAEILTPTTLDNKHASGDACLATPSMMALFLGVIAPTLL